MMTDDSGCGFDALALNRHDTQASIAGAMTAARAALDRFPGTLMEGAVADMLNSGAFAANLKRVRKLYRDARDVLAQTLEAASDGALSVPVVVVLQSVQSITLSNHRRVESS